jgi:arylsulfatase A
VRVPFVARWPGRIPAGTASDLPAMNIDLLPTLAKLAAADLPKHPIDGLDIWPIISGQPKATAPHDALYFYWGAELHAVRAGRWKLHLPHPYQSLETAGADGLPGKYVTRQLELSLFDLEKDPGESVNVAAQHPDVVTSLMVFAERAREDLGDALTKRPGTNLRPAGTIAPAR